MKTKMSFLITFLYCRKASLVSLHSARRGTTGIPRKELFKFISAFCSILHCIVSSLTPIFLKESKIQLIFSFCRSNDPFIFELPWSLKIGKPNQLLSARYVISIQQNTLVPVARSVHALCSVFVSIKSRYGVCMVCFV